jgi:AraC-like DNA-binding protein
VEHYWIVRWKLPPDVSYSAEILPNPGVNMSFTCESADITGVVTKKFTYTLSGTGCVLGIQFRAGGFFPFIASPVVSITDKVIPVTDIFDTDSTIWSEHVLSLTSDEEIVAHAEQLLRSKQVQDDKYVAIVNEIIHKINADHTIRRVDTLAQLCHMNERTLQHLLRKYVGVGPKWIIGRYRLQDAAAAILEGNNDWPRIASEMGYADQSHFIRDFKNIIGKTPSEYSKISR